MTEWSDVSEGQKGKKPYLTVTGTKREKTLFDRGTDKTNILRILQVSLSLTVKGERKLCEADAQQLPSPVLDKSVFFKNQLHFSEVKQDDD